MANPPKGKAKAKPAATKKPAPRSGKATTSRAQAKPVDSGQKYVVSGTVTYADSTPAVGLTVIAYDKDMSGKDNLGQPVVTTESGTFAIPYNDTDFRRTKEERGGADVIVCVYNAEKELLFTSKKQNNAPANFELNIKLPAQPFVVRGTVTDANQKPLANLIVRAFDCDLRNEEPLGKETRTNQHGHYVIPYTREDFTRAEKEAADIKVRIYAPDSENEPMSSEIVFNALADQKIDMQLPEATTGKVSVWEHITQVVLPLLANQGKNGEALLPRQLDDKDIDFIVKESGLDREQLRLWALADKFAHEYELINAETLRLKRRETRNQASNAAVGRDFTSQVIGELLERICFFGWFLNDQPQNFDLLVRRPTADLLASLDRAVAQNHIPPLDDKLKAVVSQALESRRVVEEIKPSAEGEPASVGDALRTMPQSGRLKLDDAQGLGAQVVSLLLKESAQGDSQWQQIRDLVDDDALFNSVRRTIGLTQLTGGHVPLIEALQLSEVSETAATLADLVKHDRQHWITLAKKHGTPKGIEGETEELRSIQFGQQIAQSVEMMHPVPFIHHRVLAGQIPVAAEIQKPLAAFLTANPGMRIKDGSVLLWLDSDNVQSGGLSEDQIKKITPDLLKIERVAKLVPTLEYIEPIMKRGYESGRDIVHRHSREVFVNEMHDLIANEAEAGRIYDAAAGAVATTEALVLTYSPIFGGIDLPVMPSNVQAATQAPQGAMVTRSLTQPLKLSANLQRLFGSQDYCECAHGASLYGPAAYLADLLHMLARGKANAAGLTALQVLLDRRPDLAEIDLTADNTDITLPYIDLVLEILEAPDWETGSGIRVTRNSGFDTSLDSGVLPQALALDVASWGFALSENLTIGRGGQVTNSGGGLFNSWLIRDQQSGLKLRLIGVIYTAYRLRANPQSVAGTIRGYRPWTSATSATIRNVGTVTFPWKLPFDIARDEANTWLTQLGATRAEVMQALSADRWNDNDIACEYLDISPAERRIFNAAPAGEHKDWGFANASITTPTEEIIDPIAGAVGKYDTTVSKIRWKSAGPDRLDPPEWHALLKNVSLLRSRARLTHRELLNVLETRFVRASSARLEITGAECDTAKMRFEAMDAALAHRIHIFVRLWRKLGWSTVDLDRAIVFSYGIGTNVGGHDIFSNDLIRFVANVARLHASSKLSISQLLDLFGPPPGGPSLDTTVYWDHTGALPLRTLSRYRQWFDNPTLGKPRLPEFQLNLAGTALNSVARTETGLPKVRISDHLPYVAAALAMSEAELAALLPSGAVCIQSVQVSSQVVPGAAIEVKGASLKEIEVVISKISAGTTFSLHIQSRADDQALTFVDVPSTELQGGRPNPITFDSSTPEITRLTYTGSGKYLQCKITPQSGSTPSPWVTVRILTRSGIVTDELTLANLTVLCRYALLRRLMGVPLKELRMLMALSGASSLADINGPEKVLALLDSRDALSTLGISISQADELLLGPGEAAGSDLNARVEALLTTIRAEAQAIRDESTVSDDKRSNLLKSVLTGMGWDERLIADVLGAEGLGSNFGDYEAPLASTPILPTGLALPTSLTYDADTKRLIAPRSTDPDTLRDDVELLRNNTQIIGSEYDGLRTALQAISVETGRRADLLAMAQARMRAKKLPTHRFSLDPAPGLKSELPAEWKGRFYHDPSDKNLCFVGWMTLADKVTLKSFELSPPVNSPFASAIDSLYLLSLNYSVVAGNELVVREGTPNFLTIETLLLHTEGLETRCGLVLERLLPEWRQQKLHDKLSSTLSQGLGITLEAAESLIALPRSAAPSMPSFESLIANDQLLASDPATKPTRVAFEEAFDAATRILILGKLVLLRKMDAVQVPWLGGVWDGINLTVLPTQRVHSAGAWGSLKALSSLIALRDNAALGVLGLQEILAAIPLNASSIAYAPLAKALGCSEDTLRVFASADGLNISASVWFRDPSQLLRLMRCLELARQMHMPATLFVGVKRAQLMSRTPAVAAAEAEAEVRALRQMVLGKSTSSTWTDDERKVLDGIRQRRRDATVDYLVQEHGVLDANDLYGHYLIDPQMNPCMMTSRIKQAISSVQLFIQRCFMNLEEKVPPNMIDKPHWEWMKNYRVWEANRKVLLYPENWIEPELRDDKTPFFDDVVSSLQQGDATSDKAQLAVQGFLEKLTDLSRVDIVATCSSYDDNGFLLVTHVFARTLAEPHTYWYRQFIKQDIKDPTSSLGIWTAWQLVDLDIEGDHLFPFVWQGRLFLFWAIFSEEAQEPTDTELQANGKPKKIWRLKLAWSEFKSGKWSSRRLTQDRLLFLRLSSQITSAKPFYFSTSALGAEGVTIKVYWAYEASMSTVLPIPLNNLRYLTDPVSIFYFDGNNIKIAGGMFTYFASSGGYSVQLTERISYSSDAEIPIDSNVTLSIDYHKNMKKEVSRSSSLTLSQNNGVSINTKTAVTRSTQLLYSPVQGRAVFSAPRIAEWYFTNVIPRDSRTTPFIQSDWMHGFFVYPTWRLQFVDIGGGQSGVIGSLPNWQLREVPRLHFHALDWPQANRLRKTLSSSGLDKLLSYDSQVEKQGGGTLGYFDAEYAPSSEVLAQYPSGDLEFSPHSATAQYNWELFFHAPFAIACSLSKNQRFEEARRWFHYIFDPTDNSPESSPKRYWRFRPFHEAGQGLRIDVLVRLLADTGTLTPEEATAKSDFQTLIAMWKDQPFQPHLVARMRIRSYMYAVVMKYLDNLIAWGDQLFRRETLETLNEATQLYILAAQILGRRPEGIPRRTRPVLKSFSDLFSSQRDDLDDLSNALVEAENLIPSTSGGGSAQSQGNLKSLYFCVPNNPKLLEYYDRVEDRLFKLRNCMNIDGVVRHLPLFEPAIDPSLLVRAAAAGVDVSAVLADLNAPLPFYRFNVMAQKATELCSEVKGLGAALLSAIEKGDAEAMALMRSGHELQMLQSVRLVKELQLHEAKANIDAIGVSLESAQKRFTHYVGLVSQMESLSIPAGPVGLGAAIQSLALSAIEPLTKIATFVQSSTAMIDPIAIASMDMIKQVLARTAEALTASLPPEGAATDKVPMNAAEKRQLSELKSAHDLQKKAMDQRLVAQVLAKIPDFTLGAQGWTSSPVVQLTLGGTLLSSFANFSASILDSEASEHTYRASLHSTLAGYQRRAADWLLQAELAAKDIEQITKQIAASGLRIAIASQELRNHDLQAENAQTVDEFMHSKYSNRELYNWMSGQLSNLHFQAYQLAYDVAKRAERCFKHELGVDSAFIKFGYWDNLKKGLLAGENLLSDLKRMEVAYLNQNARELEITKHVSLRQLNAQALLNLRRTGRCEFSIPELLFDLDFPGHYFRRIKSVSVSVPSVVGPYVGVTGTLRLMSSKLRDKAIVSGTYSNDAHYRVSYLPTQAIATSTGQNDSGLFELNFRDERYLPFEGAGAISNWEFELPSGFKAFDYGTISDLILHVRYTARDGGQTLAGSARSGLVDALNNTPGNLVQLLSLRHDFSQEWAAYRAAPSGSSLQLTLSDEYFPYLFRTRVQVDASTISYYSDSGTISGVTATAATGGLPNTVTVSNLARDLQNAYLLVPYTLSG